MKSNLISCTLLAATAASIASAAFAEDIRFRGNVGDIFGHRLVVTSDAKKYLVNLGPKIEDIGSVKAGDIIAVEGDLNQSGEVRAYNVTLADGKKVEVSKDRQSWSEWLMGQDKTEKLFTAADAKALAQQKGYALQGEPMAEKRHFVASATKDGKTVEVALHRDGSVQEQTPFTGADARKLATDKGYTVSAEPVQEKRHYMMVANKGGKAYELAAHRDGTLKEAIQLTPDVARKMAVDAGYQVITEPVAERKHFVMLGRKGTTYSELHAHRDGDVDAVRTVDKTDAKWGANVQ